MNAYVVSGTKDWKVFGGTKRSQAAEMRIAPGDSEGGTQNRHPKSDQWLFVLSGRGQAIVEGRKIPLQANALLLIKKGERHQIMTIGRMPLKTLNFYGPPAY